VKNARYWNQERCRKVLGVGIKHPDAALLRKHEELTFAVRKASDSSERTMRRECALNRLESMVARLHYDGRAVDFRRTGGVECTGGAS